jgi:hypothetical protein
MLHDEDAYYRVGSHQNTCCCCREMYVWIDRDG